MEGERFEHVLHEVKRGRQDTDLSADELAGVAAQFQEIIRRDTGKSFPEDPPEQLRMAIGAVFGSWMGRRAVDYRRLHKIPDDLGTAVNVQAMVFGNMGNDSATGVAFTRNPATGAKGIFGEYLINAQGEDVVAGVRTPRPIAGLAEEMPAAYEEFLRIAQKLELHYKDMQDVEFTVERGKLWMLQTRTGKRTGAAAVRIAVALSQRNANYQIAATLDSDAKTLAGSEKLMWRNTSGDTLRELQFHLYLNAFRNSSTTFMKNTSRQSLAPGQPADGWGWVGIVSMRNDNGEDLLRGMEFIQPDDGNPFDKTVVRVRLGRPLLPGATTRIDIVFTAQLPYIIARTGYVGNYFMVAQWFPKVGVYETAGSTRRSARTVELLPV